MDNELLNTGKEIIDEYYKNAIEYFSNTNTIDMPQEEKIKDIQDFLQESMVIICNALTNGKSYKYAFMLAIKHIELINQHLTGQKINFYEDIKQYILLKENKNK